MGSRAVETLLDACPNRIIVFRNNQIETDDLGAVAGKRKDLNPDQLAYARKMGCIVAGDERIRS